MISQLASKSAVSEVSQLCSLLAGSLQGQCRIVTASEASAHATRARFLRRNSRPLARCHEENLLAGYQSWSVLIATSSTIICLMLHVQIQFTPFLWLQTFVVF